MENVNVDKKLFRPSLLLVMSLICFAAALVLSFEKIDDPDAWIHLGMGKLITAPKGSRTPSRSCIRWKSNHSSTVHGFSGCWYSSSISSLAPLD